MKKITILHIIVGLDTGGAEKVLSDVLKFFPDNYSDQFVVSMTTKGVLAEDIEKLSIPIYTLGMKRGIPSIGALLKLRKIVREVSPDVIQGWMYHGNLMASVAGFFKKRVKIFWAIHHSLSDLKTEKRLTRILIKLGRFISGFTNGIIYVSKESARQHELIGYASNRTRVIPNGVDLHRFKDVQGDSIRNELGIAGKVPIVSLIARHHPVKGHDAFFQAVTRIMVQRNDVHFVLAGRGVSDENKYFRNLKYSMQCPQNMHLLGERKDINKILSATTISMNCSKSEAFPISVAEAMACGVPCVVTDVGDSAYLLGVNGKVVPPNDSDILADAVLSLLSLPSEELSLIGKSACMRVQEFFSIQSVTKQYYEFYQGKISE